jgi:hypothetical protein
MLKDAQLGIAAQPISAGWPFSFTASSCRMVIP